MKITNSLVALAASMLAPVAAADVTITLSSRTITGGSSVVVPSLSGTLTGASINLTAVSGDPYSSDLTVVVTPGSSAPVGGTPKIGLAQIGGWWGDFVLNSNANTRLYWGDRGTSETAVPLVRGPVNFTSSFNLTTNSAYRVWITNGYTNGSGTFTATVTLHGVSGPSYYADNDHDGFGAGAATVLSSASSSGTSAITYSGTPSGYVTNNSDCDDTNASIGVATTTYYRDQDGDGYGTPNTSQLACTQPSGYVTDNTDCNDGNAAIKPGAIEVCDAGNVDENCNGVADNNDSGADASGKTTFYRDQDNDTYSINTTADFCDLPSGYKATLSSPVDCNDTSASVYPGAPETCANDGTDNDCDGEANADSEASNSVAYYVDSDSDNYGAGSATMSCTAIAGSVTNNTDCNDGNAAINPGASEVCDAGNVDENCNGLADNNDSGALSAGKTLFYRDQDNDTHSINTTAQFCDLPSGYRATLSSPVDCNDTNAAIYPGAVENCANLGVNNDCDGANDAAEAVDSVAYYVDGDSDNYGAGAATMSCTAIAGSVTNNTDCDDSRNDVSPAGTEVCDGANANEDCDAGADDADPQGNATGKSTFYRDEDNDGHSINTTAQFCDLQSGYKATLSNPVDCVDNNAAIYPGAVENCANDGTDNDCDGEANADSEAVDSVNYYTDADSDTFGATTATGQLSCTAVSGKVTNNTDCNDGDSAIKPTATEVCDPGNVDENCNGVADNNDSGAAAGGKTTFYVDADGDTHTTSATGSFCDLPSGYRAALSNPVDCNDGNAAIYPGAVENCANDGVDNDCDGEANADSEAVDSVNYYTDADSDTFGATTATGQLSCTAVSGKVTNNTDCDDTRAGVNPAAQEVCDASDRDEDCDSLADNNDPSASSATKTTFYVDADGDTHTTSATGSFCDLPSGYRVALSSPVDCDDAAPAVYPGAVENCANDGTDNDCDGEANADSEAVDSVNYYTDADSDNFGATTAVAQKSCTAVTGKVTNNTDCNDGDSAIKPTATEICDSGNVDENCNGVADNADSGAADAGKTNFYRDQDNDGRTTNTASRFCDLPAGYEAAPEGDCADNNAAIYPGAIENCANLGVDNDCDTVNDAAEAVDSVAYYVDGDSDGFGAGSATMSCAPIGGSVTNSSDCDDTRLLYADSDSDGYGFGPAIACGVANNTDGCPTDGNKQAPGVCGCGTADTDANNSGTADCADVTLAMNALSTHIGPTGTLTVRVSMGASAIYSISGAGLSVAFDATKLQFVSATPVAGGPFSSGSVVSSDNVLGTLRYTLSLGSSQTATQSAANLVDLAFSPVLGAEACGTTGLVSFGTVGGLGTSLSYSVGGSQSPVVSNLGAIYLDQTAPVITNAFADTALAADAGTIAGAAVTAPTVTAFDACANESRPVSLSIALAGGGTVTSWPARFPVGVSTITWSSTDRAGNTSTDVHTVTVANHQLLDLSVGFVGVIQGTSSRQIRVTAGGQVSLHTVNLTGNSGSVTGVQVPVAASYPCIAVKCPTHSVTDAMSASVAGVRYAAVASLPQGDCNDDDMVEIFDYAIFVSQRGAGKATNAIANFNGDTAVGNADFTFIALNFFASGETCTPNVDAPQPRDRMSVKDLRRAGYGHLAVADLNRDGWVDLRDMQMYMQGAGMQGTIGAAQIESRTNGTRW